MYFFKKLFPLLTVVAVFPVIGKAQSQTLSNALNPNLSVIGNMLANTGPMKDGTANRISFSETELAFQAAVDPYAKADFFVSFPEGKTPELEEGYVSLLSLPWDLRARGGKFLASFGRLNWVHSHEKPQVDSPLVLSSFFGEEGLKDVGLEVSKSGAPFNLFTELSYALLNGLGEEEPKEAVTTTVTDTNGNVVTVVVNRPEEKTERQIRNFAHVARARVYKDISEESNLELGLSGLLHQPKDRKQTKMGGLDLTFRWKPLREGTRRSFIWRTELLYSVRDLRDETNLITGAVTKGQRLHRRGAYSYVEFQPTLRWKLGIRGDYVESPEAANTTLILQDGSSRTVETSITRAVCPYVTFALSEFNRFRLEYQNKQVPGDDVEHRVFFQWVVVLGPHGAHPF